MTRPTLRGSHLLVAVTAASSVALAATAGATLAGELTAADTNRSQIRALDQIRHIGTLPLPAPGTVADPASALADVADLITSAGAPSATIAQTSDGDVTAEIDATPTVVAAAAAALSQSGRHTVTRVLYADDGSASLTIRPHLTGSDS